MLLQITPPQLPALWNQQIGPAFGSEKHGFEPRLSLCGKTAPLLNRDQHDGF